MSKIIRVENGDYKVVSVRDAGDSNENRGFISIRRKDSTGAGSQEYPNILKYPGGLYSPLDPNHEAFSVTVHTGNTLRTGTTELTGSLLVHGDTLYTSNPTFYILDKDVNTIEFAGDSSLLNIGNNDQSLDTVIDPTDSQLLHSIQNVNIANSNLTLTQTIQIADSQVPSQFVDIANSVASVEQQINIGNSDTPVQVINAANLQLNETQEVNAFNSVSALSQTIKIANSTTPVQFVEIGSSEASTSQTVHLLNSNTPAQNIVAGNSSGETQWISLFNSVETTEQLITVANTETPTQEISIANSTSTEQSISIGNSTTNIQEIEGFNITGAQQDISLGISELTGNQVVSLLTVSAEDQQINIANSTLTNSQLVNALSVTAKTQTITLGDSVVTDTQQMYVGNATADVQEVSLVNSTTNSQSVNIANSVSAVEQSVTIASSTTPDQMIEIGTSEATTRQTISVVNKSVTPEQNIKIGNLISGNLSQSIEIGNSISDVSHEVLIANATTTDQIIKLANSTTSVSQLIEVGVSNTATHTVNVANAVASTRQDVDLANSVTPIQTIDIGNSVTSGSQEVNIANSESLDQTITIGSVTNATLQTVNLANAQAEEQVINVGNSIATAKQTAKLLVANTELQTVNVGSLVTNDIQSVQMFDSNSSSSQNISIGNSTTPIQTIDIGNSTVTEQTITIGNVSSLQTITIGGMSEESSTYNIGSGATADTKIKTINIGTNGQTGSTTNVNIATGEGSGGTTVIGSGTIIGEEATQNLWNSVAETVNAFGNATEINIGFGSKPGDGTTTIRHDTVILGDLTVWGDTTSINTETLVVEDKNIQLAFLPDVSARTDLTADGGGITLVGATDKTLNWYVATNAWTSNVHFDLETGNVYRINNTEVLSYNGVLNYEPTIEAFLEGTSVTLSAVTGTTNIRNNLDVDLNIEVGEHVYPTVNNFSDLGKIDSRFKDIYLHGKIYVNNSIIESVTEITDVTEHNSVVINSNLDLNSTGYLKVPAGTLEQRPGEFDQPTAELGQIRFNTTGVYFEGYDGIRWKRLGGVDTDNTEQYGALTPFVMDRYDIELYKTGEYTVQVENPLSNHSFKAIITHNGVTPVVTISNEVIIGAPAASISARIENGFVEIILTPTYEGTEVQYSRVLLDNDTPVDPAGISNFPANELDVFDLQTTNFNIDLEVLSNSSIDLMDSRVPGYGGILPLDDDTTQVIDFETTNFNIDLAESLNTNLINNTGLVNSVLQCIPVGEQDKLDLSIFYYYIHPALSPVLLES